MRTKRRNGVGCARRKQRVENRMRYWRHSLSASELPPAEAIEVGVIRAWRSGQIHGSKSEETVLLHSRPMRFSCTQASVLK